MAEQHCYEKIGTNNMQATRNGENQRWESVEAEDEGNGCGDDGGDATADVQGLEES